MQKFILLLALLFGYSLMAHADDVSIDVNSNNKNFTVSLNANPTTGYQWKVVSFDKGLLTLSGSQYQKPNNKLIGAGGKMLFTFTLNKGKTYPAKTDMVFKYARPWEDKGGTVQKVTVNFETQ
ncbi:protease inhibitor I42 family protein [Legionella shakespearei]|uniref:Secreted protein n=1 Tax=Legionella shakespearei DSM 23087 TaxID=1122169 RepID=A0A0W0YRD9_9GAMM|nr:protease inhibitor I42 family protein [Legionella shakespearei]KTD59263.1 secreted protein [Legionella shakespearei DSM 23087]